MKTLFVFLLFMGLLWKPLSVSAGMLVEDVPANLTLLQIASNLGVQLTEAQLKKLAETVKTVKFSAYAVAYKNALKFFLNTVATDSATWIASGGKGQKPLWETRGWNVYLTEVGGGAFGTALDSLTEEWDKAAQEEQAMLQTGAEVAAAEGEIDAIMNPLDETEPMAWGELTEEERVALRQERMQQRAIIAAPLRQRRDELEVQRGMHEKNLQTRGTIFGGYSFFDNTAKDTAGWMHALKTAICNPNANVRLNIALGLGTIEKPKAPSCTWQQMNQNWETLTSEDRAQTLSRLSTAFDPGQNDLTGAFQIFVGTEAIVDKKTADAEKQRAGEERQGGIRVLDHITGAFKLPPYLSGTYFEKSVVEPAAGWGQAGIFTGDAIADGVGTFANTLTNKLTERLFKKGMLWLAQQAEEADRPSTRNPAAVTRSGAPAIEAGVGAAITPPPNVTSLASYDYVDDFTACPKDPKDRSVLNCVMDRGFSLAVKAEGRRGLLSVADAMKKENGLLQGGAPFGYKDPKTKTEPDAGGGYSHTNIKKLRLARIVPAGWEFAAQRIAELGESMSLERVLQCFADPAAPSDRTKPGKSTCPRLGDTNGDGRIDDADENAFWHLVDPNWILKSPQRQCPWVWPTATVVAGSAQRHKLCVDVQDCVVEDSNGKCLTSGYCTREKNIFRVPGQECPSQFSTCQKFTKSAPSKSTGQGALGKAVLANRAPGGESVSYLRNSVTACPSDAAGCRWYASAGVTDAQGNRTWDAGVKKYFNREVQACDPKFEGCQEFKRVAVDRPGVATVSEVEGVLRDALLKDQYAANTTSLFLNGKRAPCSSPVVGCESYMPVAKGGVPVSAVLSNADLCPSECVSYNVYRQVGTNFEPEATAYFIPDTATSCTAENAGCDQFTNVDEEVSGGEATEYFSALRLCEKPGGDLKTFTTKEVFEVDGQQDIAWDLKKSNLDETTPCTKYNAADGTCVDDPQTNLNLGTSKEAGRGICTEAESKDDGDCRRFIEPISGKASWRFLSKTITEDAECHPYRKTTSDAQVCQATGGRQDGTECVYSAFAPNDAGYKKHVPRNTSCPQEAKGCREYNGTIVGNVQNVFRSTFDDSTLDGWTGVQGSTSISPASLDPQGKSLRTSGRLSKDVSALLMRGKTYEFSFLARADEATLRDGKMTIQFRGATDHASAIFSVADNDRRTPTATLSPSWNSYRLGPVVVTWDVQPGELLEITGFSATAFFDSLTLTKTLDSYYLLKNSWTTPASCDTDPALNPTLDATKPHYRDAPAYAIGCQYYRDRQKNQFPLRSTLSNLCGAEYVGCEAIIDTQNSNTPKGKRDILPDQIYDNTVDDAIAYVVNDPKNVCPPIEKGCRAFGLPGLDPTTGDEIYTPTMLRDNPERYQTPSDLCRPEHVGCEAYSINRPDGGEAWFFDPLIRQQNTCEQKNNAWVLRGTTTPCPDVLCEWKQAQNQPDLFNWFIQGTNDPCPPDTGVKACGEEHSGCTELYEPFGREQYYRIPSGEIDRSCTEVNWKAGCVLFDERTVKARGERDQNPSFASSKSPGPEDAGGGAAFACKLGEFSEKRCTADPKKMSDPTKTGDPEKIGNPCNANNECDWTESVSGQAIRTIAQGTCALEDLCDTNAIFKVERDRTCSEWLQCMSNVQGFDPTTQQPKDICYGVGRCQGVLAGNTSQCGKWSLPESNPPVLDAAEYQKRDVTWKGREYSGYSIPGLYPIENLRQRSYTTDPYGRPIDFRLTYDRPMDPRGDLCVVGPGGNCKSCTRDADCALSGQGTYCNKPIGVNTGVCFIDAGIDDLNVKTGAKIGTRKKSCRGYPEDTSPFPAKVVARWKPSAEAVDASEDPKNEYTQWGKSNPLTDVPDEIKPGFTDVKVAQPEEDAECSYQKVTYKGVGAKFYGLSTEPPSYIPGDNKQKSFIEPRRERRLGWRGYCLEQDLSLPLNGETEKSSSDRACLTWWPIDLIQGEVNIFNTSPEAEYSLSDPKSAYYCIETKKQEYRKTYYPTSGCILNRDKPSCASGYYREGYDECSKSWGRARRHYKCNVNGSEGWYDYNGLQGAEWAREICTKVAQVYDETKEPKNVAWTSRIADIPHGAFKVAAPLDYTIDQKVNPYGALASPSGSRPDSSAWNKELVIKEDGKQDFQDGSAYAYASLNETWEKGRDRLSDLFAKSYGIFEFSPGKQCVKQCKGAFEGKICDDSDPLDPHKDCKPLVNSIGVCTDFVSPTNTCYKGLKSGTPCNPNVGCAGAGAYCDVTATPSPTCVGGSNPGSICTPNTECIVGAVSGTCTIPAGQTEGTCTSSNPLVTGTECTAANSNSVCQATADEANGFCVTSQGTTDSRYRVTKYCVGGSLDEQACSAQPSTFCEGESGQCKPPAPDCIAGQKGFTLKTTLPGATGDVSASWDVRDRGEPPVLKQVKFNDNGTVELGPPGITVERKQSGVVGGETSGGVLPVNLSFYAYNTNGEQLPLRQIIVEWGDGQAPTSVRASMKNHKAVCNRTCSNKTLTFGLHCTGDNDCNNPTPAGAPATGKCNPDTFGDTTRACTEDSMTTNGVSPGYFTFLHVYSCSSVQDAADGQSDGLCTFKPRVQVLDNWGWCNGSCRPAPKFGCFDNEKTGDLQCTGRNNGNAWTSFNGTVVVPIFQQSDVLNTNQ